MISGVAETDSGAAPAILLPADPDFRQGRDKAKKTGRIRWGAVLIAALFHAAILAVFLLDWSFALSPPPVVPPPGLARPGPFRQFTAALEPDAAWPLRRVELHCVDPAGRDQRRLPARRGDTNGDALRTRDAFELRTRNAMTGGSDQTT